MKSMKLAAAFAVMIVFAQSAYARPHAPAHHVSQHEIRQQVRQHVSQRAHRRELAPRLAYRDAAPAAANAAAFQGYGSDASRLRRQAVIGEYRGGSGARPAAWCGWEMRRLVGRDPGPAYNLARNWAHWGQGGAPGVGAVVVWPHHVGKIVGRENGQWVVESGNDGHAVRTRPRSISGAIAIRWG
jgi:hypothetical protein